MEQTASERDDVVAPVSGDRVAIESEGTFLYRDDSIPSVSELNTGTRWDIPPHSCLAPKPNTT